MQFDKEGFLYPVINENECVQCNMCEKVCPFLLYTSQIIINSKVLKRAIWETMKQICEKEFCEDLEGLKDSIGSNIGLLIEDMRK